MSIAGKEKSQSDGRLTLFDMYAQIFNEAEYHCDPKATEQEGKRKKYKNLPTEVIEVPLPGLEQS